MQPLRLAAYQLTARIFGAALLMIPLASREDDEIPLEMCFAY